MTAPFISISDSPKFKKIFPTQIFFQKTTHS